MPTGRFCQAQAVLHWYFIESSIMWLGVIAISSYRIICNGVFPTPLQEIIANVICWGLPLGSVFVPLSPDLRWYGPRGNVWCSFAETEKTPQLVNLLIYVIPTLCVVGFCYYSIFNAVRSMGESEYSGVIFAANVKAVKKMSLFVITYLIVWSPITICYIAEAITGTTIPYFAEYITANLLHVQGVLNFVVYGFNSALIKNLRFKFCGYQPKSGACRCAFPESGTVKPCSLPGVKEVTYTVA